MRKNERKYGKRKKVEQMPLTMATMGEVNKIVKVGGNEETRRFLENLGFVAGTEITVVSSIGGNLIVNVKDSRIAVNEDTALYASPHEVTVFAGYGLVPVRERHSGCGGFQIVRNRCNQRLEVRRIDKD